MVTSDPKNDKIYRCDDKCPMYKGFSLCSHVITAAEDNGDLKSFLESVCKSCTPNLSAIANGMPSGSGRKGVPKRKRTKAQPIQSRSVRQCLQPQSSASTMPTSSLTASQTAFCSSSILSSSQTTNLQLKSSASTMPTNSCIASQAALCSSSSSQSTNSGQFTLQSACTRSSTSVSYSPFINSAASTAHSCYIAPTRNTTATGATGSTVCHYNRPLQRQVGSLSNATITPTASSHSQVLVGGNVFNFAASPMSVIPRSNEPVPNSESPTNPFVLKMKTKQIRVCQSCRKDYSGPNDTMGLLVARAERRLVSNLVTGTQFLG